MSSSFTELCTIFCLSSNWKIVWHQNRQDNCLDSGSLSILFDILWQGLPYVLNIYVLSKALDNAYLIAGSKWNTCYSPDDKILKQIHKDLPVGLKMNHVQFGHHDENFEEPVTAILNNSFTLFFSVHLCKHKMIVWNHIICYTWYDSIPIWASWTLCIERRTRMPSKCI